MQALVISDLHFGAWTSDPLLARPFARERLAPHLDGIDELILLGDVFDLQFSPLERSFAEAEPFFDLLRGRLQGKRVVFLAGNHDHHVVIRTLRSYSEFKVATGVDGEEAGRSFEREHRNFVARFLERKLEGVEVAMAYPTYRLGSVLLSHGHYLDAHLQGSLANRLLRRVLRSIGGGRSLDSMTIEDYEAVIVPFGELIYTVAQMPGGTSTQQNLLNSFERYARVLRLWGVAQRELGRVRDLLGELRRGRSQDEPIGLGDRGRSLSATLQEAGAALKEDAAERQESAFLQLAQPGSGATAPVALRAYGEVVRNLGWNQPGTSLVFGHTHQPLDGEFEPSCGPVRFWNTGSWIFQPSLGSKDAYRKYLETAWPGTALLIDSDRADIELVGALDDQNPLHGGGSDPELRRQDDVNERALTYERALRG
jgi:UDP-2,3-diacylglucosamine pyrophosphatase LpxH